MFKDYQNFPDTSGIYKITTRHNNFFYIGSSVSLSKRMKDYRNLLKTKKCHVYHMQKVFDKYGETDFTVDFLLILDKKVKLNSKEHKELIEKEEQFISSLKPQYNTILTPTCQINNPATAKKVYQYDLEGNFIAEWNSGREVLRELNIQIQNGIKNASSGGFQWSYQKVDKLSKYKRLSGLRKKVQVVEDNLIFDSVMDYVNYLQGDRNIYQNITYAIKVGKKFRGKTLKFYNAS